MTEIMVILNRGNHASISAGISAGRNLPLNLSFGVILFCISISSMVPQTQPLPLLLARVIILSGRLPTTSIFPGDVVIVDNCAIPQKRVERILTQFLG